MRATFETCQPWLLTHEGGFVNHPKDPGGATNQGITQRTYDAWRKVVGLPSRDVRLLEAGERDAIYREQYWEKVWGDKLPAGVDYALYDFAVNSGPARAVRFVQELVGTQVDGVMGVRTLAAIMDRDPAQLVVALCSKRMRWMSTLSTFSTFGTGWTRRVMGAHDGVQDQDFGVVDRAVALSRRSASIPAPMALEDGAGAKAVGETDLIAALLGFFASIFGKAVPA
ncbi:glycoside hydrolase family 108 protein [Salipiger sp. H15]|uniref:Glycoside hydrolase family 108 protein n=1 Tax=Alloyangia sp. H15 TaxID=3029062 RepID=A0AAU8ALV5_9RHOB